MKAKKPRKSSPASRLSPSACWALRIGLALFLPLLLFGGIEIGLRIAGYGFPTHLFVKTSDGARLGINEKFIRFLFRQRGKRKNPTDFHRRDETERHHAHFRPRRIGRSGNA